MNLQSIFLLRMLMITVLVIIMKIIVIILSIYSGGTLRSPLAVCGVLLGHCRGVLAGPLVAIINKSLKTATYLTLRKDVKVIPVHKKGWKNIIENYRPISILSALSEVFEMCLCNIIYAYFSPVVSDCQHGFLPHRSTITNLICSSNFIRSGFSNNYQTDTLILAKHSIKLILTYCWISSIS